MKRKRLYRPVLVLCGAMTTAGAIGPMLRARAEETSNQPYIDQLKRESPQNFAPNDSESYTEKVKRSLPPVKSESYIEQLKKEEPENFKAKDEGSYTEKVKPTLEPKPEGGAIAAVKEGRSELQVNKREGTPNATAGIRVGVSGVLQATPVDTSVAANNFQSIYGNGSNFDLGFYMEHQFFRREGLGSIGVLGNLGVSYSSGFGAYEIELPKPGGGTFGLQSDTKFQFFTVPITAALAARLSAMKYVQPFVMAGPTLVAYFESRNDGRDGYHGNSRGFYTSAGANILLDWLSSSTSWDAYSNYGIHHTYLTVEYTKLTTFSGAVDFDVSGFGAGVSFEF